MRRYSSDIFMFNNELPKVETAVESNPIERAMIEDITAIFSKEQDETHADSPILNAYLLAKQRTETARELLNQHLNAY